MAFKKKVHHVRHYGSRVKRRVGKAKPSVALLAGLAVGPAQVLFGTSYSKGPIWQSQNKASDLWDRISITYGGYQMSTGYKPSFQQGAFNGTAGIAAGYSAHWLASKVGLNAMLARMKMPFRI